MKAMILSAGRGQRMMPLTATTPKPMLLLAGKPILQYHIENLQNAGITEIVINHCYLGQQLVDYFEDGSRFGVNIQWSAESEALETAGGIRKALPLLGDEPFLSINSDIWISLDFEKLMNGPHIEALKQEKTLAHLLLVANPVQNPSGDFGLQNDLVTNQANTMWTYSGIALYHPKLVESCGLDNKLGLAPILRSNADLGLVSGEVFSGDWEDIGTPQRLHAIEQKLNQTNSLTDSFTN